MSDIRGDALFSDDGRFRHRLDRWWSAEPRALICMANPSKAGADKNDPTIHNVIRLTRALPGIGGFTIVNWEPYIATDPKDLFRWRASIDLRELQDIHAINLAMIRQLSNSAGVRIVAWGDVIPNVHPHTTATKRAMSLSMAVPLYCFGRTQSGAPKHPLARGKSFIPTGTRPTVWQMPWANPAAA
jgi:hypothetical protein